MNTKGLKYWQQDKRYCSQNNNVIEKSNRVAIQEVIDDMKERGLLRPGSSTSRYTSWYWKESCSMEAIYTCLDCMGELENIGTPEWANLDCQPSDYMMIHINQSKHDSIYQTGENKMDNRYIYSLEKMLKKMGYTTRVVKDPTAAVFKNHLPLNHGMVIHIPGHYSSAIAWDFDNEKLIWHNVNPDDNRNKNGGKFERMKMGDIQINWALIFYR